jgi:hypothetical protein
MEWPGFLALGTDGIGILGILGNDQQLAPRLDQIKDARGRLLEGGWVVWRR